MAERPARVVAFAPGRANLIGEHTDYNDGLSLPFAIEPGVTVTAVARDEPVVLAHAAGRGESERFPLTGDDHGPSGGWRDFVRGTVAELTAAGHALAGAELTIESNLPEGAGLASSAALGAALALALLGVAGVPQPDRIALARLCSRVENRWVGAATGLLDQLASLLGERGRALRIDFRTLAVQPVPFAADGWRLAAVASGETRSLAASGYNERRAECERAREAIGLESLRDVRADQLGALPAPLADRVRHVLGENERVDDAVRAIRDGDLERLGDLLDASHRSLRDLYASSTAAVERTVARLKDAGAVGARMIGGGFGGSVIGLFPPGAPPPDGAIALVPSPGARLL